MKPHSEKTLGIGLLIPAKAGKGRPMPGDDEEGESMDLDQGKEDVAQDLLDAIEAKDAKAVSEALSAHYDLCASSHHEEYDEGE